MVYLDWNKIMAITPEKFSDDDKEELAESVVWYSPTSDIGRKQLAALIKVLQEIIKHKTDQVESLMSALDELAAKQGEEVARGRQELLDELEELREQLEYQRRLERDTDVTDDQLRSDVVRLEMQNEELVQELQEREKDLGSEKAEVERLVSEVARLEREKLHVVRELSALQDETNERLGRGVMDSPEGGTEKVEELLDLIRQKNKHIMQLLDDLEAVEQDNQSLKIKVANLKDQYADSSKESSELSAKIAALQVSIDDGERKIFELTDQNKALTAQITDLVEKKAKHDSDLDEFAITLNSRVEEWRRLLDLKDVEIMTVKEELKKHLSTSTPWNEATSDEEVKSHILQQELEISKLKTELAEAFKDISKSSEVIEELNAKILSMENQSELSLKISALEMHVSNLKKELEAAEEDATNKAAEITKLVVQLRAYEREEYGLSDAIDQAKKMEKRLYDKELKFEKLIASCNQMSIEKGNLEDENIYLREKLGLSPTHEVDSSSVRRKSEADAQAVKCLLEELEKLREEIMELKIRNRELSSKLASGFKVVESTPKKKDEPIDKRDCSDTADFQLLEKKYSHIVCENDALRKGMHEILEGIQRHTMGNVEVTSLERLLEALDARHVSGWYHPAMRLQAQLNTTKGECKELRNQVRTLLEEKKALTTELKGAQIVSNQIQIIDDVIVEVSENNKTECNESFGDKLDLERRCIELELTISQLQFAAEKAEAEWMNQKQSLIKEKDAIAVELANSTGINCENSELNASGLSQALEFLKIRETSLENDITDLRKSFIEKEEKSLEKVMSLQKDKADLLLSLRELENRLLFVEPSEKVVALEQQLCSLKLQYNIAVTSSIVIEQEQKGITNFPSLDHNWENIDRRELLDELRIVKEKLHETETLLNSYGDRIQTPDTLKSELSVLASKLAAAEVREAAEKQRNVHLGKVCEILKAERAQLDVHVGELTCQLNAEKELNDKLQLLLNDLDFKNRSELFGEPYKSLIEVEQKYEKLKVEKKYIEELLNISRSQYRSLQAWQSSEKLEKDSYNECILLLQTSPGEKMALLKINHELAIAKKANIELSAKNAELNGLISYVSAESMTKDSAFSELLNKINHLKHHHLTTVKFLFSIVDKAYNLFNGALFFPSIKKAQNFILKLEEMSTTFKDKLKQCEVKERELALKEEEFNLQLDALHDLKAAFQSDSKNLVNWHNKSTELRLRETRCKRQNEFLSEELAKSEVQNKLLSDEIETLEENMITKEREWDQERKKWLKYSFDSIHKGDNEIRTSYPLEEFDEKRSKLVENAALNDMERKIADLMKQNERLTEEIVEKEAIFEEELSQKNSQLKSLELMEADLRERDDSLPRETPNITENKPENVALQVTVTSLQSIVKQKDATLLRYQDILKKTREEQGSAMRRLQNELKNVHSALAMQSKAYSRLKHGVYQPGKTDIEKYVTKVQELEEELAEVKGSFLRVNDQLKLSQIEAGKWRDAAEDRMALVEETRERLEIELERCREEMHGQEVELHSLRQLTQGGQSQQLLETIQDLQQKLNFYGDTNVRIISGRKGTANDTGEDNSSNDSHLHRQLKASKEECSRLREQVKALRDLKKKATSVKTPSQNQENLVGKIQKLEEMLQLSKQHEQQLEEQELKKIRNVEEVTRWDERKRHQQSIERLSNQLKQKKVEVTVALNKVETMKGLMAKLEREKAALEVQLRQLGDSPRVNPKMERLLEEKAELAAHVAHLEEEILALHRHTGGKAAAILHERLESQERELVSLKLADQSPVEVAEELDRLNKKNSYLERMNLQLETENLNLKLSSEKLRVEIQQLQQICRRLETEKKTLSLSSKTPSRSQVRATYDSQREINKHKEETKITRQQLSAVMNRNTELEEEVQRLANQLALWEEKDMAMSVAKSKQQMMINELHQELTQVKGQLAHKVHLLDRVKILLSKAAAKEKALNEKVVALQTMMKGHHG